MANPRDGKIEVIFGPMFSGKSTELLRRIRRHAAASRKCVVIKYKSDTRYSDDSMATHDRYL
jgi:thymidine kinase